MTTSAKAMKLGEEDKIWVASQWQLMWWKFRKAKMANIGGVILIVFYLCSFFPHFLSPYPKLDRTEYIYCQPQKIHFMHEGRFSFRPFVYGWTRKNDPVTLRRIYVENTEERYNLRFFVRGEEYKLLDLVWTDLHLFGVEEGGTVFLFGTDKLGRDMFSRTLHGATISLSVGLLGVALSFVFGSIIGGVSGFYGGVIDTVVQRIIEFISSVPTIPLWMALSAALPRNWPPLRIYFGITIILSFQGWTGLARAVRGKLLELREEDFVMAARLSGATDGRIIVRHLLPAFLSYLIVSVTLAIPNMILGETSLSFLNLGLRPPVVSWGVLLQQAQNVRTIALQPWLLIPAIFIVFTVLSFNALGDGLRDAADPYKT
jgi:peptide/nickel transport system permease protein